MDLDREWSTILISPQQRCELCEPQSWYHCQQCVEFDSFFRRILDEDIMHLRDHELSTIQL